MCMESRLRLLCVLPTVLLLVLAGLPQCTAVDRPVTWSTSPSPTSLSVNCTDTITLTWSDTHDVLKAATGDCPTTTATRLSNIKTGGTYEYTVTAADTGSFWLICSVPGHCNLGQNIKVTSTCPATANATVNGTTNGTTPVYDTVVAKADGFKLYNTTWRARKMMDLAIVCGDDVLFYWKSATFTHALLLKPYVMAANMNDTCANLDANNSSQKLLVPASNAGNYTWTPTENGDYYFACTVGQHCLNGQRIRVTVTGCKTTSTVYKPVVTVDSTKSPTPSPSPSPKPSSALPSAQLAVCWAAAVGLLSMLLAL